MKFWLDAFLSSGVNVNCASEKFPQERTLQYFTWKQITSNILKSFYWNDVFQVLVLHLPGCY